MGETLNKILGRREVMAYAVVGALVIGFLMNKISSEQFIPTAGMIVAFYFGQRNGMPQK